KAGAYWTRLTDRVPNLSGRGLIASMAYDPVTKRAYFYDGNRFHYWDPATAEFTYTGTSGPGDYHYSAAMDPETRLFFVLGTGKAATFNVDTKAAVTLTGMLAGCEPLLAAAYPGIAYHPASKTFVGWAGGGVIYKIDPVAKTCATQTFLANAPGKQMTNGTNGRFQYFPDLKVFVLVNSASEDAYLLTLE
ncbi:unnamed protein product, partial [marine sediment metagenome]